MTKLALTIAAVLALVLSVAPARAEEDDLGQDVYNLKCASCHGRNGKGKTDIGVKLKAKDLTQADVWKDLTDAAVENVIAKGTADKVMPAYKDKLSTEEMAALVKYLHSFQPKKYLDSVQPT